MVDFRFSTPELDWLEGDAMSDEADERLKSYAANASEKDVENIGSKLGGMNRGPIAKLWSDVQALWAMILDPSAAWASKSLAIGALVYLVSPIDAVPDFLPILGLTDDAGVLTAVVSSLYRDLEKYKRRLT
jgi:uncharacterized membrane protein YkvA (DUF1232 family)